MVANGKSNVAITPNLRPERCYTGVRSCQSRTGGAWPDRIGLPKKRHSVGEWPVPPVLGAGPSGQSRRNNPPTSVSAFGLPPSWAGRGVRRDRPIDCAKREVRRLRGRQWHLPPSSRRDPCRLRPAPPTSPSPIARSSSATPTASTCDWPKSILGLLLLAAGCGARLDLEVCGPDAEQAAAALADLIAAWSPEAGGGRGREGLLAWSACYHDRNPLFVSPLPGRSTGGSAGSPTPQDAPRDRSIPGQLESA
jgi:hypothetical protein